MNLKTKAKYLFIYLLLNTIGVFLAFKFWWIDPSSCRVNFLFYLPEKQWNRLNLITC